MLITATHRIEIIISYFHCNVSNGFKVLPSSLRNDSTPKVLWKFYALLALTKHKQLVYDFIIGQ